MILANQGSGCETFPPPPRMQITLTQSEKTKFHRQHALLKVIQNKILKIYE